MSTWIRRTVVVAALLGFAALLAGCGQKGPLYLPDQTQGQQQK